MPDRVSGPDAFVKGGGFFFRGWGAGRGQTRAPLFTQQIGKLTGAAQKEMPLRH